MPQIRLEREVRFLKAYAVVSTLLFLFLFLTAFRSAPGKQRFTEIDVERINVVEADGRLALVLSNQKRLPGLIVGGKEIKTERKSAGMLFFNGKGNEAGGLTYSLPK